MKVNTWFILFLIAIALLMIREFFRPGSVPPVNDTIVMIDIIPGDSVPYPVEIKKKVLVAVYIDTGSTRWRDRPVDTMAILQDYFAKYYYDDILMDDSSAFIRLMAHTFQNRLYYDTLLFQNRREKAINTTIINPVPKQLLKVYAGIGTSLLSERPVLTGDLLFVFPKGYAMSTGYDFMNKEIHLKGYIPIRLRKK